MDTEPLNKPVIIGIDKTKLIYHTNCNTQTQANLKCIPSLKVGTKLCLCI